MTIKFERLGNVEITLTSGFECKYYVSRLDETEQYIKIYEGMYIWKIPKNEVEKIVVKGVVK